MKTNITLIEPEISLDSFVIRPLTANDAPAYRALRKHVMDIGDARYHSASYRRDKKFKTDEQLRIWCTETSDHCIMGAFLDGKLVGLMTVVPHEPKESLIAEWDSVWLDSRYRHLGVARLSYEKLEKWTKERGYKFVETFVRADNHRMLEIRKKRGSVHFHTKRNETWADGSVQDAHFFLTNLYPNSEQVAYARAISFLEATCESLGEDDMAEETLQLKTGTENG